MLYNTQNANFDQNSMFSADKIDELVKAISAGQASGTVLNGQLTSGAATKYESLEATLKNLSFGNQHFTLYNTEEKKPARSTNEEYTQMVNYGRSGKYSIAEGELPESSDTAYRRMSEFIKFKGIVGQVTDVAQQVNTQVDLMTQEVQNKMTLLLQSIEMELFYGDLNVDPMQFDGIYRLHKKMNPGTTNEDYFNSPFALDVRGSVLTENHVNGIVANVVNQGYGLVTDIFAPPIVFTDFVNQKTALRRIISNAEVQEGKFGQKVAAFASQFGEVLPRTAIFGRRSNARFTAGTTAGAQATKAPAGVTPDISSPLVGTADAVYTKFGTDYAGDYFVAIAATNQYGEGPIVALSASLVSVAATESIKMKFAITDNAYPATGYVVYRSEKNPTSTLANTPLYPVFNISVAELAVGYDGSGSAGTAFDRNYQIPNTEKAFLYESANSDILSIKELGKIQKLVLAKVAPVDRFAILYNLTQILYSPYKVGVINNIGKRIIA